MHPGMLIIARIDHVSGDDGRGAAADVGEDPDCGWAKISSCAFRPSAWIRVTRVTGRVTFPKWWAAVTAGCTEMGALFYGQALETVVPVSSTQVAEMVKLLENTFRMINIGLVNEMALMCDRMGIDMWEVIEAAATKPFGFMPFYPGPGLGGHCIPIDPFYLSWKSEAGGHRGAFHRTGRAGERVHAALCGGKDSERAER